MLFQEEMELEGSPVARVRWTVLALGLALGGCRGSVLSVAPAEAAEAKGGQKPSDMVVVPAGKFTMGCDFKKDEDCSSRESPAHEVDLDAFYIDVQEVSVGEYVACVKAGACTEIENANDRTCTTSHNDPRLPLDCVSQVQAAKFCTWMSKRLPTEAEWEKTARGTDRRRYSWGNSPKPSCENLGIWGPAPCTRATPRPRGTFPLDRSPFGVRDMTGSVGELVADNYAVHYYEGSPAKNPTGPAEKKFEVVVRGGRYTDPTPDDFSVYGRFAQHPTATVSGVGFRCAKSASDTAPVRALAAAPATPAPAASAPALTAGKPGLDAETCADPCALLTLYAYDELAANACKLCKKYDDTFCEMSFPFNDVPACDAYDELRNCVFARFGYVFSKPKWQQQFSKMPWYKPDPTFTEAKLPPVAKANVQRLKDLKAKRQGCR